LSSLRIAYLTGEYPRATDTFIQREVAELRKLGFEVLTCSIRRTSTAHHVGDEQRQEAKNTFHVLSATSSVLTSVRSHFKAVTCRPKRYTRGLALAWRVSPAGWRAHLYQLIYFAEAVVLAEHLLKSGVQHLHNHIAKSSCTVAMLASTISGIPYSFTLHGPDIFFEPTHWRLDEKIARASFVACISHFCRSQAMTFSDPQNWDKLHIVHCGVEPARYALLGDRTGNNLLFVGRLAAVKGVPLLLMALQNLLPDFPKLHLTFIGDGPERARLEEMAASLGVTSAVTFAGYRGQSEVAAQLQTTDVLVLPSFAEGVPVVLMEAMAAEVPVVTTRIAGIPELVEDRVSGALVRPGDVAELTDALREILADEPLRKRYGAAGRKKVIAEFDIQAEAAWLGTLIDTYANGRAQSALRPTEHSNGTDHV
jgi:glycosyltransferase involved in cell wall biosynthesis